MEHANIPEWEMRFTKFLESGAAHTDGSHDLGHFQRVWKTAKFIHAAEGGEGDLLVILTAAYFHDWVALPKNHPERSASSKLSADKTAGILATDFPDFPTDKIEKVHHAIHAHSFSAGVPPVTPEAKILQDADRLEALGAIGLARVFYTAGQLHQKLFDPEDPLAVQRPANDQVYSLDHFRLKLFKLPVLMNTVTGRRLAEERAGYLEDFLVRIDGEIRGEIQL